MGSVRDENSLGKEGLGLPSLEGNHLQINCPQVEIAKPGEYRIVTQPHSGRVTRVSHFLIKLWLILEWELSTRTSPAYAC